MAALRLKAHSLREEAAKAKVEAADVGEDSALQFLEALRVELGAEESLLVDCTCTLPPSCPPHWVLNFLKQVTGITTFPHSRIGVLHVFASSTDP